MDGVVSLCLYDEVTQKTPDNINVQGFEKNNPINKSTITRSDSKPTSTIYYNRNRAYHWRLKQYL